MRWPWSTDHGISSRSSGVARMPQPAAICTATPDGELMVCGRGLAIANGACRYLPARRSEARPRPKPSALPPTRCRAIGDAPLASFHLHDVKQRSFFVPAARFCARVLCFLFTAPPNRGVGGAPGGASLEHVALVKRDATLARRGPSRATGRPPLGAPPWRCRPGTASIAGIACRLRREGSTQPGISAGRGTGLSCPRLRAAVDATSRSAVRIVSGGRPS